MKILTPEELDTLGQESDIKASKWVKEKTKERLKEEDEEESKVEEKLGKKVKNENLYRDALKNEAKKRILEYDIPPGYNLDVKLTSKGLAFGYRSFTDKIWFMRGMKISGLPIYDINGIEKKINEALDEIDLRVRGKAKGHKSAGGIDLN